jgi:hypothetical protein
VMDNNLVGWLYYRTMTLSSARSQITYTVREGLTLGFGSHEPNTSGPFFGLRPNTRGSIFM